MTDPENQHLRDLLHDAVSEVHPTPALADLRRRTRISRSARRTGPWLVVPAAAAAVAVIVGGVVLLHQPGRAPTPVGGPAASSSPATVSASPTSALVERTVAVYYVGDGSQGPRLYREFHRVSTPGGHDGVMTAVQEALSGSQDPDYRTSWPQGTSVDQTDVSPDGNVTLSLSDASHSTDLRTRPAGMSDAEATAAVQQIVYTAQAAVQNRNPVRIQLDGKDADTLLGVDVSAPVPALSELSILSLVSISDPAEGAVVRGSFVARGVASSFEANVPWKITRDGKVVKSGFSTATGWMDRLYPWKTDPIDVSALAPGRYTFVAMTDDPSSGEGGGPQQDTRTIVVLR